MERPQENENEAGSHRLMFRQWASGPLIATCCMLTVAGCGGPTKQELPQTHSVHGTVKYADGKPLTEGMVQFQSLDNPQVSTSGLIDAGGNFTVETFIVGQRAAGAILGPHRVTILPSHPSEPCLPTVLAEPVTIVPGENEFQFTANRP